jgi:hypothetical protein
MAINVTGVSGLGAFALEKEYTSDHPSCALPNYGGKSERLSKMLYDKVVF